MIDLQELEDWDTVDASDWTPIERIAAFAPFVKAHVLTNYVTHPLFRQRDDRDDLIGDAYLSLVVAVNRWPERASKIGVSEGALRPLMLHIRQRVDGDILDRLKKRSGRTRDTEPTKEARRNFANAISLDAPLPNGDFDFYSVLVSSIEKSSDSDLLIDAPKALRTLAPLERLLLFTTHLDGVQLRTISDHLDLPQGYGFVRAVRVDARARLLALLQNSFSTTENEIPDPHPLVPHIRLTEAQAGYVSSRIQELESDPEAIVALIHNVRSAANQGRSAQ